MLNVLKTIGINIASIVALPLLIISAILKIIQCLIGNTFYAILTIIKLYIMSVFVVVICGLVAGTTTVEDIVMSLIAIVAVYLFFFKWFVLVVSVPLMAGLFIYTTIDSFAESTTTLYINFHKWLLKQYKRVKIENKILNFFSYIILNILRIIHFVLKNLFSSFKVISIVVFVVLIVSSYIFLNTDSLEYRNMSMFEYIFSKHIAMSIADIIIIILCIVSINKILLAIANDMVEYGKILKLAYVDQYDEYDYEQYKYINYFTNYDFNERNSNEEDFLELTYMFEEMVNEFESLVKKVNLAIEIKDDVLLVQKFNKYAYILNEISQKAKKENKEKFNYKTFLLKYKNDVKVAVKLRESIYKILLEILEEAEHTYNRNNTNEDTNYNNESIVFFKGCDTEEKLKKTYRKLCKTYHPDEGGDIDTFKKITNEYESLLKAFQ